MSRNVASTYGSPESGDSTLPAGTSSYAYNAFNERVWKAAPSHGWYRYAYAQGGRLLSEHRDNGDSWTHFLWFGGQLVGMVRGSTLYYVHTDHLDRPELVTDAAQSRVWLAANYPFTRRVLQDSIGGLNLGFPGQYYDQESVLWYTSTVTMMDALVVTRSRIQLDWLAGPTCMAMLMGIQSRSSIRWA